jgi:hypothetical protein
MERVEPNTLEQALEMVERVSGDGQRRGVLRDAGVETR